MLAIWNLGHQNNLSPGHEKKRHFLCKMFYVQTQIPIFSPKLLYFLQLFFFKLSSFRQKDAFIIYARSYIYIYMLTFICRISRIPKMKKIKRYIEISIFIISIQPLRLTWDNDYTFYCTFKQEKMLHCLLFGIWVSKMFYLRVTKK